MEKDNLKKGSAQNAERLLVLSDKLDDLVSELNDVCVYLKQVEDSKRQLREVFFELANEYLEISGTLERKVLEQKWASRAEAELYVSKNRPGWRVIQYQDGEAVIEEDPAQMKFEWTNHENYHMGRTTAVVGTEFDFEMLKDYDPDLFREIVDSKVVYELNEKKAEKIIEKHPHYLNTLQESTKPGKIQLRMSTPRKVEDE